MWDNVIEEILISNKLEDTPQKMISISKSFLQKEINTYAYQTLLTRYVKEFIATQDILNISKVQYFLAHIGSIDCSCSDFAYKIVTQGVECLIEDKFPDLIVSSLQLEKERNKIYQRIIDECILIV